LKIICEHIYKSFPSAEGKLDVLEDINISTEQHDFVCILGANGCGKTTLLKIMAMILKPTQGSIHYINENHSTVHASLIYQEQGLFPWLTAIDNACFGLEMKGMSKQERYKRSRDIIEQMGLTKFVDFYPYQLSAGMKQKVNLIRGLLMDSAALLIDEPDTSLDSVSKILIRKDIYRIWKEYDKTIIYVTHDIGEALELAKHIWVMGKYPGKIIEKFDIGLPDAISDSASTAIRKQVLKNRILEIIGGESNKI
jgi:NitT/TauT family transport system ATP-binding protein